MEPCNKRKTKDDMRIKNSNYLSFRNQTASGTKLISTSTPRLLSQLIAILQKIVMGAELQLRTEEKNWTVCF